MFNNRELVKLNNKYYLNKLSPYYRIFCNHKNYKRILAD